MTTIEYIECVMKELGRREGGGLVSFQIVEVSAQNPVFFSSHSILNESLKIRGKTSVGL